MYDKKTNNCVGARNKNLLKVTRFPPAAVLLLTESDYSDDHSALDCAATAAVTHSTSRLILRWCYKWYLLSPGCTHTILTTKKFT